MYSNFEINLTNRQTEELAKFCMDLSKLSISSLVFSLFSSSFGFTQIVAGIAGLTFSIAFLTLSLRLFKEIK